MINIRRDNRIITVAEIYEQFLLNKYENIQIPESCETDKLNIMIGAILVNMPISPLIIFQNKELGSYRTTHKVVQGKERVEQLIYFIKKNEKKNSDVKGDIICLTEQAKHDFWQYKMPVHYIDTELTDKDLEEFLQIYKSI